MSRDIRNRQAIDEFLEEKGISQTNHLCTGASPSPILSYLVNQPMFDEMKNLCDKNGISMTIYVDDTIFSSNKKIGAKVRSQILNIVQKYGYRISLNKVKYYSQHEVKKITGVVVRSNGKIDIPNKLRFKIKERFEEHKKVNNIEDLNKLAGCVVAARQINKQAYPSVIEYIATQRKIAKEQSK